MTQVPSDPRQPDLGSTAAKDPSNGLVRARILRNVAFNWTGRAVSLAVGLVTVPVLIQRLGDARYGQWIIIGALTGYFWFFDFGMRGAIGRHVAFYDGKNDTIALNRMFSTALAMLCGAALLALVGGVILAFSFDYFIRDLPTGNLIEIRIAILILAFYVALFFFWRAFDAFLWGLQRFDLINIADIPTFLLRLVLTIIFVTSRNGLITLAWITLGTSVLNGLVKLLFSYQERPSLCIRPSLVASEYVRELLSFGIWQFVSSICVVSVKSFVPATIGATLGAVWVVPYSLAVRLIDVAGGLEDAASGVVAPLSTVLHARKDLHLQQNLFVKGTRCAWCLSLFFTTAFLLFGRQIIVLWVGSDHASASSLLAILALGAMLPVAMGLSDSVLIGLGKPRLVAITSTLQASFSIAAAIIFGRHGNLIYVCLGIAAASTLFDGIIKPLFAARLVNIGLPVVFKEAIAPAIIVSVAPTVIAYYISTVYPPQSFSPLFLQVGFFGLLSLFSFGFAIFGLGNYIRRRLKLV